MFVCRRTAKKIIRNGSYDDGLRDLSSIERTSQRYANILIRYPDVVEDAKLREKVYISLSILVSFLSKKTTLEANFQEKRNSLNFFYVIWDIRTKFSSNQKQKIEDWKEQFITKEIEELLEIQKKGELVASSTENENESSSPSSLWINAWDHLKLNQEFKSLLYSPKRTCHKCKKEFWLYCTKCGIIVEPRLKTLHIKLPFELIVVFDIHLRKNNRTATHALALCPDQVDFQNVPRLFIPTSNVALLYPSDKAEDFESLSPEVMSQFKTFVLIESTWEGAEAILKKHPELQNIPHIKLSQPRTMYWRNNGRGSDCLSTIETIYHLASKYSEIALGKSDDSLDGLLTIFTLELDRVQKFYQQEHLISPFDVQSLTRLTSKQSKEVEVEN